MPRRIRYRLSDANPTHPRLRYFQRSPAYLYVPPTGPRDPKKWKEERDRGVRPGRSDLEVLLRRQLLLGLASALRVVHHSRGLRWPPTAAHHAADDDSHDQADHEQPARERIQRRQVLRRRSRNASRRRRAPPRHGVLS